MRVSPATSLLARLDMEYPGFVLHARLDLELTGVIAVVGPSGAGKTTLLRCLAGLQRSPAGYVRCAGEVWQDESQAIFLPVHRRGASLVFQDARLFQHMNVHDNLDYARRRAPRHEPHVPWHDVLEVMDIGALLKRRPAELSAGEQQRVAMARALLCGPRLLLMDEPLALLDDQRKREIMPFVVRLYNEFGIPIIYVSHAIDEVLQIADTIVVMDSGETLACGSLGDVCARPELARYISDDIGGILTGRVASHESHYGLTCLQFMGQPLYIPLQDVAVGETLRVHIHSRDVTLAVERPDTPSSVLNVLQARVTGVYDAEDGYSVLVKLDVGAPLVARITRKSQAVLKLEPGQAVFASVKAVTLKQGLNTKL